MELSVQLVAATPQSLNTIAAAARTCYSSKGIVLPDAVLAPPDSPRSQSQRQRRDTLVQDLYRSGHHTTIQHVQFHFALTGVSRLLVWSLLHNHPFYNSEQVSQRYVQVKPENMYRPPELPQRYQEAYDGVLEFLIERYRQLAEALMPQVEAILRARFPHRDFQVKRWRRMILTRAWEVARYVLPLATQAYLHHTVSALTLLRYHQIVNHTDAPAEARRLVNAMIQAVLDQDPDFALLLQEPPQPPPDVPPGEPLLTETEAQAFDQTIGQGQSRLLNPNPSLEHLLAQAYRTATGQPTLSDAQALAEMLDPAHNPLLAEPLNLTYHLKTTQPLLHACWTFQKKLSHTADSQDQRHRMTPASRPRLRFPEFPDYLTPALVQQDPELLHLYHDTLQQLWDRLLDLHRRGMAPEHLLYLLPNAVAVRFYETFNLLAFRHKVAMRLCYNAQEEIWRVTHQEVQQISQVNPGIAQYLRPPCWLRKRAGKRPYCPEGARYCGVQVWLLEPPEMERVL